jgi:bile acid-coenzyme A ligase
MSTAAAPVPYGRRLTQLATKNPHGTALVFAARVGHHQTLSWINLESRANQIARLMERSGVADGDVVVVALGNTPDQVAATFAGWKVGASVLPLRKDLPRWERERILGIGVFRLVVADWTDTDLPVLSREDLEGSRALDTSPIPGHRVPKHSVMIGTGGSTGTPKIVASMHPGLHVENEYPSKLMPMPDDVALGASPLYHGNGTFSCFSPLLEGAQVVLMESFDAARAVELIEQYHITTAVLVPTMLQRIARLDDVSPRQFESLRCVVYGAAVLPEWAARAWLQLVKPERFYITYNGSEQLGLVMCTGAEWLERPGTVGIPVGADVLILDSEHRPLGVGEIGEIWLRSHGERATEYVGMPTPEPILGGYLTFGDLGWLDDDGYLYIADRRQDMIISGGVNVYPAEVESALSEHPDVADVVVIGLPDPEWGHRVHAIVEPRLATDPPSEENLRAFCKARLTAPKVPKSFEVIAEMPRTSAGKVNRSRLVEERIEVTP